MTDTMVTIEQLVHNKRTGEKKPTESTLHGDLQIIEMGHPNTCLNTIDYH